ncbi:MAG: DUF2764 family protein [Spirochaetaceae bacterium]
MRRYYYTVSTLPMLSFDGEAPFSLEEFHEMCRGNIAEEDFARLTEVQLEPNTEKIETGESVFEPLAKWWEWETALRNELTGYRSQKLGWEGDAYVREGEVVTGILEVARNAASQESPLQAEELLDRARWDFLDQLETGRFFEFTNLVVYSLKLQLLLRRGLFTRERGEENFQEIYRTVREDIQTA